MECRINLCLNSNEISRARSFDFDEVQVRTQDDVNSWDCEIISSSVTKGIKFLNTISDLRGMSDEELEESYIREVR